MSILQHLKSCYDDDIYGGYEKYLHYCKDDMLTWVERNLEGMYHHISGRVKSGESMRNKCIRKGLSPTAENALLEITDSIGIRIVCDFISDVYDVVDILETHIPDAEIELEKDYITNVKPSGYRSYHIIIRKHTSFPSIDGTGDYIIEIQVRTIAMDTWAALEHKMSYKKDIPDEQNMRKELRRIADELTQCDLSMQSIRMMIDGDESETNVTDESNIDTTMHNHIKYS